MAFVEVVILRIILLYILFCFIVKRFKIKKLDKFVITNYFMRKGNTFDYVIGATGSGKSTLSAYYLKQALKKGRRVFSITPLAGAYKIDLSDIGVYDISHSLLIIDEAGIAFDNRKFMNNFTNEQLEFFKKHRHYDVDILIISQALDTDKKLRDLSKRIFLVKRSIIPLYFYTRQIKKDVAINDFTKDLVDGYNFVPFTKKYFLACKYWKYFNSLQPKPLKQKQFELYNVKPFVKQKEITK